MTFVQHLETIAIVTASPNVVKLGLDERWVLPEQAVGGCSLTQMIWG